jgi:hypothetical protein
VAGGHSLSIRLTSHTRQALPDEAEPENSRSLSDIHRATHCLVRFKLLRVKCATAPIAYLWPDRCGAHLLLLPAARTAMAHALYAGARADTASAAELDLAWEQWTSRRPASTIVRTRVCTLVKSVKSVKSGATPGSELRRSRCKSREASETATCQLDGGGRGSTNDVRRMHTVYRGRGGVGALACGQRRSSNVDCAKAAAVWAADAVSGTTGTSSAWGSAVLAEPRQDLLADPTAGGSSSARPVQKEEVRISPALRAGSTKLCDPFERVPTRSLFHDREDECPAGRQAHFPHSCCSQHRRTFKIHPGASFTFFCAPHRATRK